MYTTDDRAEIPCGPGKTLRLWRAPLIGSMTVRFLSPLLGLLTHRPRSADMPCPGADDCPPAMHRGKTRWKGYAPVYGWRDKPFLEWVPGVVEVTERLEALMDPRTLRGEAWEIWREPGESGHVEVTGRKLDRLELDQVDALAWIVPVLNKVYRVSSLFLGVQNPFRAQLVLPAVKLAPPPNALGSKDSATEKAQEDAKNALKLFKEARAEGRA